MPDEFAKDTTSLKLTEYNDQIVEYLLKLREQRNEITELLEKQKNEKANLECDMEKLAYKMTLVSWRPGPFPLSTPVLQIEKSLKQRALTLDNYNKKILEAETKYQNILQKSESLLSLVKTDLFELDNIMNKKVGTMSIDK